MKLYNCEVCDAKDYKINDSKRPTYHHFKQFDRNLNGNTFPVQMMLSKLMKNNAWSVTKFMLDSELNAHFEVAINADTVIDKCLTYEQICNEFGWKSFKLDDAGQTVLFKKDN